MCACEEQVQSRKATYHNERSHKHSVDEEIAGLSEAKRLAFKTTTILIHWDLLVVRMGSGSGVNHTEIGIHDDTELRLRNEEGCYDPPYLRQHRHSEHILREVDKLDQAEYSSIS